MTRPVEGRALLVAGPTCSGKSALALWAARRLRGSVINADSMQIYRELRVLTARPTPAEEALAPHRLYGVRPAAEPGSAAWWRSEALREMRDAADAGRLPILCGGTGLYFQALLHGLADVPDPGPAAREEARRLLAALGPPGLHARLAAVDPRTAARLRPSDGQRLSRAWEVWRGTGAGLAHWVERSPPARPPWRFGAVLLHPPREALRPAIGARFALMLEAGALDEVRALLNRRLDPALPAMRAHGVPELAAHLRNELTLPEAAARAEAATRRYTKRQDTWFRHHELSPPARTHRIHARFAGLEQFPESSRAALINFVDATAHGA